LPELVGDGVVDDTAAIQARLDSSKSVIYLPEPEKHYVIKKMLVIHSKQTLKLDADTLIRLIDGVQIRGNVVPIFCKGIIETMEGKFIHRPK
jgi:hypothetical protein